MPTFSFDDMVDTPSGKRIPKCWDWNCRDIADYVDLNKATALKNVRAMYEKSGQMDERDRNEDERQSSYLIQIVLIDCLRRKRPYTTIMTFSAEREPVYETRTYSVPYYNHSSIRISDVYTALGWFISIVEPPKSEVQSHQSRLICYSRLCLNISNDIKQYPENRLYRQRLSYPTKTYQLIVGRFGLLTSDSGETLELMSWLSSTTPYHNVAKGVNDRQAPQVPQGSSPHPKSCAESFDIASLRQNIRKPHTNNVGQAVFIDKLNCPFVDFPQHLVDAGHHIVYFPSVIHNNDVQQFDYKAGLIPGPLPLAWSFPDSWQETQTIPPIKCSRCECIIEKDNLKARHCLTCKEFVWCSYHCFQIDNIHAKNCPPSSAKAQQSLARFLATY